MSVSSSWMLLCISSVLCLLFIFIAAATAAARRTLLLTNSSPLMSDFYQSTCPSAESIVRGVVGTAVAAEPRMAASLLRLHFHDCFVQGCDGSVLLRTIPGALEGEQEAGPNNNSLRGLNVVDDIKKALERQCPGVVSCADIVAMAARDSVAVSGGPTYGVLLGRYDSRTASRILANKNLPGFDFNVSSLIASFANVGLSARDMVALSGAHTIGKAHCNFFADRLTPNPKDPTALQDTYHQSLYHQCAAATTGSDALANLDLATPTLFDNGYYTDLQNQGGFLHSDQVLYSTPGFTQDQVDRYAASQSAFFSDFATAMIKMGNIAPLTSSQGEVRRHCGFLNSRA